MVRCGGGVWHTLRHRRHARAKAARVQGHVCMHACIYTPGPRLLAAAAHSGPPSRDAIPRTCPDRFVVERDGVNERALWVGRGRKRQGKRQQASTRDKMCTCMHSCSCLPACMHTFTHGSTHSQTCMNTCIPFPSLGQLKQIIQHFARVTGTSDRVAPSTLFRIITAL